MYSHNIVALLEKYGVPKHLDYVSIDVDSTDIWLVEALLRSSYRPRIISAEFNPNYPFDVAVTFPTTPSLRRRRSGPAPTSGCSLTASRTTAATTAPRCARST